MKKINFRDKSRHADSQKNNFENQHGFSLIEVLLYLGLLVIISSVAIDLFLGVGEFSLESTDKNVLQQDARYITDRVTYSILRATNITTPAAFGDASRTNSLQLELTLGFSPTESHKYILNGSDLLHQKTFGSSTQSARLNSNQSKLNYLWFSKIGTSSGKPTIKVIFELEAVKPTKQGSVKQVFETAVGIR